ncbi:MAG: transmembrane anchor protein [Gemmatimonadaceae bacterium]|nr:transmembrane anchor protein [Gemmatimonadaceae bacterium]
MSTINSAPQGELPSARTLLKSTAIALVVAIILTVTVVMPAEYGVDPTGVGRVLQLTEMGEIKMQLAREAATLDSVEALTGTSAAPPAVAAATGEAAPASSDSATRTDTRTDARTDTVRIALEPNQGREIKLAMREGARVSFTWSTDRGVVNYDTHADRTAPPAITYHGYAKGQGVATDDGVLVAAFDGMHGWFWRNRSGQPLTVTLRVTGDYTEVKEVR